MLSVPTLWTVFVINFLALGLIWAYVMRSYPKFEAARFWTGSAFAAAAGAAVAMLRFAISRHSLLPLLAGGTDADFRRLPCRDGHQAVLRPAGASWRGTALITGLELRRPWLSSSSAMTALPMRIFVYSLGQTLPFALTLKLLLSRRMAAPIPGARLAGIVAIVIIAHLRLRAVGEPAASRRRLLLQPISTRCSRLLILVLVFLSMALNFGFLLMAIDRLRNEVADLALLDDLTGVGNRRHLLQRLTEECARSERSEEPFALLVIDLDGFKGINDTHGHAAGDACLQHFTLMAQTRLRPGDMLARTGGDEFCIVLPSSTLREGAMIARRVLDGVPRGRRAMRRRRYSDRGLDRGGAMDPRDRRVPRPADRGRRPCALRRQERRPELLCRPMNRRRRRWRPD